MSKIKIIQIASIPCANSAYELSKLINVHSSKFESHYILGQEYSKKAQHIPYRQFPYELLWENNRETCLNLIRESDIVHIHHDTMKDEELEYLLQSKKVVWTLYNLINALQWSNNLINRKYTNRCKDLSNLITVANQPLQKVVFSDITDIKVPLIKFLFNENTDKSQNLIPVIVFSPTNKDSFGIHTKKYKEVLSIINQLKQEGLQFEFILIEGVPYEQNLELKRKADILIDDVDPNYEKFHNSSLESCCFGAIPLTNYSNNDYPFVKTTINTLKETLRYYINNPEALRQEQQRIVGWRMGNYTPQKLLLPYERIYTKLINNEFPNKQSNSKLYTQKELDEEINKIKEQKDKEIIFLSESLHKFKEIQIQRSMKEIVIDIINNLKSYNIVFWLLKESCLEIMTKKEIVSKKLIIGVNSVTELDLIKNKLAGYLDYLEINVDPNRQSIQSILYGLPVLIPFPTIRYLKDLYRKSWSELRGEK
jgi:hypothetical protein